MMGMHGTKCANNAVQECDLLVCIGARFDDRATGPIRTFAPHAKIIHLDVDPAEMGKRRAPDAPVIGDLRAALWGLALPLKIDAWRRICLAEKKAGAVNYDAPGDSVHAPRFLNRLAAAAIGETFVACDVGQHQMWVAQHYPFARPEHQLTSGGLGAMGYGLPAAIGAQVGRPDARVILVTGDGSVLMNIHELATIARYRLPVKIVLLDNQFLGMVRQWQELFHQERFSETDLSDNPDFVKLAEAFGIPAFAIESAVEEAGAIERLLNTDGPALLQVRLDPAAKVWPIVPPGKSNGQMLEEPRAKEGAMS
jgi:acetolactate synthase-1/2/3 large subunit